jgi:hypothetical protein
VCVGVRETGGVGRSDLFLNNDKIPDSRLASILPHATEVRRPFVSLKVVASLTGLSATDRDSGRTHRRGTHLLHGDLSLRVFRVTLLGNNGLLISDPLSNISLTVFRVCPTDTEVIDLVHGLSESMSIETIVCDDCEPPIWFQDTMKFMEKTLCQIMSEEEGGRERGRRRVSRDL